MTINATFLRQLEDGTAVYRMTLSDPEHLAHPQVSELVIFEGEIVVAMPILDGQE